MNPATAWAVEKSAASGTERAVLVAIARRAIGCVAICEPHSVMREVRIQRRAYYECLVPLEQLREVQRVTRQSDNARLRTFHLPKFCQDRREVCNLIAKTECATVNCGNRASLEAASDTTECADLKIKNYGALGGKLCHFSTQATLFPALLAPAEARDLCEDCRGTGWRTTEAGAVPCSHTTARFAGRWSVAQSFSADRFLDEHIAESIPPRPVSTLAVQLRLRA